MKKDDRLAIYGGTPVRAKSLPYARQFIDEEDIRFVTDILRGDYLTTGPAVEQFEKEVARLAGCKYAVAFANGTAALHAACFAAGIGPGDEVITSPLTFAASANCILYQGGTPVFADISPQTYTVDPLHIEQLITQNTKVIIPVDFAGLPCDLDKIQAIAQKYNLTIIEDAAHALGSAYKGSKIGSLSDMTMFSFHPVKQITTGEGGIITTDHEEFYLKLRQFRTHGITREPSRMNACHGSWYYEMQFLGYNYRMTDIQAGLGISQLRKLPSFIEKRREYVQLYTDAFHTMPEIICPAEPHGFFSSWHLYVIRLNFELLTVGRKEIYEALKHENIGVNVHYIPVYYHPFYQELGYVKGLCPSAEKLYEEIITLPLFPSMQLQDVNDVILGVKKVLSYYAK